MRRNLISKRTGIGDHMPADKVTDICFPHIDRYMDIINSNNELGECIKNQYVSIEWIKKIIGTNNWKYVGKNKSLYQYFVDSDDNRKPNEQHGLTEEELYKYASGDMQFDFDDISDCLIEELYKSFMICGEKNPCYHWFETSWSGHGCHIRVYCKLIMKTRLEWGFWYVHLLNGILKHVEHIDEIIKHIDWSCATVTRGFAIPYNEGGVKTNPNYNEDKIIGINNEDELDNLFNKYSYQWNDDLYDYFIKKFVNPKKKKELQKIGLIPEVEGNKYLYSMDEDWEFDENHPIVSGEIYNYNWRLSLVTTLMGVFNRDIDLVKEICSVIYRYIGEYKNHTYEEMIGNEFENKILKNANFDLEPNHAILRELWDDWGLKISIRRRIL